MPLSPEPTESWLTERVRFARENMLDDLRRVGPALIGTTTRLLLGITQETCNHCGGRGTTWNIPVDVQRQAGVDEQGRAKE